MEFRKYLRQGIWGLADKALPVLYGIGYVLLVIRVLPEEEFGLFVLVQEIFLVVSGLATAFALQPLLKFGSEDRTEQAGLQTFAALLHTLFLLLSSAAIVALRYPVGDALHAPGLASLLLYLPAMLAASFLRNTALALLQSRFLIQRVFWVDSVHFLGVPFLVWVVSRLHLFDSALDLVLINIATLSASSLLGLLLCRRQLSLSFALRGTDWRKLTSYGLYSLGGMTSYLISNKADTFVLSAFFGPVQVALYNAAKVFTRIFDMATQVIQMLVLPASSRLSSRGEVVSLRALVEKSLLFATVGMVPVLVILAAAPEPLLALVYGGRYGEAASLLRVISPMALVVPALAIGSSVLMGLGEARAGFALSVQTLVVSLAAYYLLVPAWGSTGAAWGYVLTAFLMTLVTVAFLRRFVPVTMHGVFSRMRDISGFIRQQAGALRGKG